MKKDTIRVIRKEPGRAAEWVEVPNELKALQREVGGYIEIVPFATDAVIICNEEGKLRSLRENVIVFGELIVGTILIAGRDGEELTDVPMDDEAARTLFPSLFKERS